MPIHQPAIAIIGMSGRFPDAPDVQAFWRNLERGHESLVTFSDRELLESGLPPALIAHPNFVKKGTMIEGSDLFDAGFFGFNPREAELIDPQHRILLECAWEAMEDAGYGAGEPKKVGVYAGASVNSYVGNIFSNPEVVENAGWYQVMIASDKDFLATRIAYKLDLRGPCLSVQTACSTSLVAVHLACQSLLARECDMALAGGVSLRFPQKTGYLYQEGMIFSPDGHCRPFDADGQGIRGGEGAGLVVLKRMEDALRDGDPIRAVILGSAVNNDGADKIGYTAPSVDGQAKVLSEALGKAGVDPGSIRYVEAHGTATPLGDPIEFAALSKVYGGTPAEPCAIGAVKSNIGHLDVAAGVAGLIKTVLAMEHRSIPPTVHFRRPNPQLPLEGSRFYISAANAGWPSDRTPRRAAVSSFGIGGTNAHVVLEEAPAHRESQVLWPEQLLVVSATSAPALDAATRRLASHVESHPEVSLADLCYTAQAGRKRFSHRRALVCSSVAQLRDGLRAPAPKDLTTFRESAGRRVIFMFSGQGAQHQGMARSLYEFQPTFRRNLDLCADLLRQDIGCDLRDLLYGSGPATELDETRVAQPVLFSVEYALAQMWMRFGVVPCGMIGHSLGEFVAACLAGVFTLEEALRVVAFRGSIMQKMPRGSMLAVRLGEEDLQALVNGSVSVAAVNSRSLCTVSGAESEIADFQGRLESRGIPCSRLHTSHAFHSKMMDPAREQFRDFLSQVPLRRPAMPFVSNVTGDWIRPEDTVDPEYWASHLRERVQFARGMGAVANAPDAILLEVGPGQTLTALARECHTEGPVREVLASLPHPKDSQPASRFLLNTLGRLWLGGVPIDWNGVHEGESLHRIPLPTYPFERRSYFIKARLPGGPDPAPAPLSRRADIGDWFSAPTWKRTISPADDDRSYGPWLIFSDSGGLADAFVSTLAVRGEKYVRVNRGESFSGDGDHIYTIDPNSAEDYRRLVGDLIRKNEAPHSLLFLWSLESGVESFHRLILLAQAFGEHTYQGPIDWVIVSAGMHRVRGEERVEPEMSLLAGPCKTIPLEYPGMKCRSVDLVRGEDFQAVAPLLAAEPGAPAPLQVVAYRGGYRWEQRFEPVHLPAASKDRIRKHGVYLITGGMGGIGLTLARYLAGFQARLALISRSSMPARKDWQTWLDSHAADDRVSQRILEIRELEALGAEVLPLEADAANPDEMQRAIASVHGQFGPIVGIIHAAGIAGAGLIQIKTAQAAEQVFAPKVNATRILRSLTKDDPLDFFVLCSSVNSILGAVGGVDYTSANAYLDAVAAEAGDHRAAVVSSINWDTWQEVGMAVNTKVPREMQEARLALLQTAIRPQEGVEVFRRVLAARLPQVAALTRDLLGPANLAAAAAPRTVPVEDTAQGAEAHQGYTRPDLATAFEPPRNEMQRTIANIWKEALGLNEVGLDDNFFELGGHSLAATGILSRVRTAFGISLPLRVVFESPTVRSLAEHVETLHWNVSQPSDPVEDPEREEVEI